MIFKFKTKKDKEIERLNELVNTLIENDKILNKENETLKKENEFRSKGNAHAAEEIEYLTKKLERIEKLRRKVAGKVGGLVAENNRLKEHVDKEIESVKSFHGTICELRELMKKREKDYLFVIRLLFNEIKFEKHTRDYLRQKMKELKEKYPPEDEGSVIIHVSNKSKSFTNIQCERSDTTNRGITNQSGN